MCLVKLFLLAVWLHKCKVPNGKIKFIVLYIYVCICMCIYTHLSFFSLSFIILFTVYCVYILFCCAAAASKNSIVLSGTMYKTLLVVCVCGTARARWQIAGSARMRGGGSRGLARTSPPRAANKERDGETTVTRRRGPRPPVRPQIQLSSLIYCYV